MSFSTYADIFVSWLQLIDFSLQYEFFVLFCLLFACLVIFLLDAGYFRIPADILEFYSGAKLFGNSFDTFKSHAF